MRGVKKAKTLAAHALAVVLCLAVCGCGQGAGGKDSGGETIAAGGDDINVPQASSSEGSQAEGGQQQGSTIQTAASGSYYTRQNLVDSQLSEPVFSAFVPEGWQASVSSDWTCVSPMYPGFEMVTITSPDGQAAINIASCLHYTQSAYNEEGPNFSTYTTYLGYMDARAYTDAYVSKAFGGEATLLSEFPEDKDTVDALRQYLDHVVSANNQEVSDGQLGVPMSLAPVDATVCRRQYQVGSGRIETMVADYAFGQTIDGYLRQEFVHWFVPYSIVFAGQSEAVFEAHHAEYETIIANSFFTPQYFSAESYVSSVRAAQAMEAKNAASQFSTSGYESPDASSNSRSVAEQWDDVIREVDTYQTLDGDYVQVSTGSDVVAQDGDQFYVGPSNSVPPGFTKLKQR